MKRSSKLFKEPTLDDWSADEIDTMVFLKNLQQSQIERPTSKRWQSTCCGYVVMVGTVRFKDDDSGNVQQYTSTAKARIPFGKWLE
ncbi:MAG: hypothetical protein R2788_11075 [Saprospiraceae bacterium]